MVTIKWVRARGAVSQDVVPSSGDAISCGSTICGSENGCAIKSNDNLASDGLIYHRSIIVNTNASMLLDNLRVSHQVGFGISTIVVP